MRTSIPFVHVTWVVGVQHVSPLQRFASKLDRNTTYTGMLISDIVVSLQQIARVLMNRSITGIVIFFFFFCMFVYWE